MQKKGYSVNEDALNIISICESWYTNKEIDDFHVRKNLNDKMVKLSRMNFAKRCCADDANLCEIVSVAPETENTSQEFIDGLLQANRFHVQYRKQLEKTSAMGTVGAYITLKNADYMKDSDGRLSVKRGKIQINYCDPECIIPLSVENDQIMECAFYAVNKVNGKEKTTLVVFRIENDNYIAETVVFNNEGMAIEEESMVLQLGEQKPFAIMTNAEVNNLEEMVGYGLPKIYNAIPLFKAVDLCYNLLFGDLDKGEKIVFINELLACIKTNEKGEVQLTQQQKDLFILLGNKLPQQDTIIKEYNPEIRIEAITKAFELVFSLLSMQFGYGSKKYSFENGQIKTATEYIGSKQDAMQELNKQRNNARDYITDIIHAAMWFSNIFLGTSYDVSEKLSVEFDDSYIEDKQTKLESMRADALSFAEVTILKVWYLMEKYNIPEKEARKYVEMPEEPNEDVED